jgi:hypothetical protein
MHPESELIAICLGLDGVAAKSSYHFLASKHVSRRNVETSSISGKRAMISLVSSDYPFPKISFLLGGTTQDPSLEQLRGYFHLY